MHAGFARPDRSPEQARQGWKSIWNKSCRNNFKPTCKTPGAVMPRNPRTKHGAVDGAAGADRKLDEGNRRYGYTDIGIGALAESLAAPQNRREHDQQTFEKTGEESSGQAGRQKTRAQTGKVAAKPIAKPVAKKPELKKAIPAPAPAPAPQIKPKGSTAVPPKLPLVASAKPETKVAKPMALDLKLDEPKGEDEKAEAPIIDNAAEAVKKMIKKGKERGFVTIDEINAALPQDKINSDMIEDTMAMLSEMGISVTEGDEEEAPQNPPRKAKKAKKEEKGNVDADEFGRTDDPVRLYLREMGSVELLSREGEIAIAKRIEAGREMMIGGICESPLTIQAILSWHDALNDGKMLLRDIIDLEATYGGGPSSEAELLGEGEAAQPQEPENPEGEEAQQAASTPTTIRKICRFRCSRKSSSPRSFETFDQIGNAYGRLFKLQAQRHASIQKGEELTPQSDKKFQKAKEELVDLVRTVRLNNNRLEQLVQQLYTLNRRLIGIEGRILRLAPRQRVEARRFPRALYRTRTRPQLAGGCLPSESRRHRDEKAGGKV